MTSSCSDTVGIVTNNCIDVYSESNGVTRSTSSTPDESHVYSGSLPNITTSASRHIGTSWSPTTSHRRLRDVSRRKLDALGTSPPRFINSIPRDLLQPRSGSISNVHNEAGEEEEADIFPIEIPSRRRAHTCPEGRMLRRKVKVINRNRPPTPQPGDLETKLTNMSLKDENKTAALQLPSSIPEDPNVRDLSETRCLDSQTVEQPDIFLMD